MVPISLPTNGFGAVAASLLGPLTAAALMFGCNGSPSKLKADDAVAMGETDAPLVDQSIDGHLINSVSFDIKETTSGNIASVVTSHVDMSTAEVSFRHFVVQFSGDRLFSVLQRSGNMTLGTDQVAPSNDDPDWVADLAKMPAIVSAAKPVTNQNLVDSFHGLSEALSVIKDPRSKALGAKLAELTFAKADMRNVSNFDGIEGASVVFLRPNSEFDALRSDIPKNFAEGQSPAGLPIGSSFSLKVETPEYFENRVGSYWTKRPIVIAYTPTFLGFSALSQQLTIKLIVSAHSVIVAEGGLFLGDQVIGSQDRGELPTPRFRSGLATLRGAFASFSDPWLRSVERYLTELEDAGPQELAKVGPFLNTAAAKGSDDRADAADASAAGDEAASSADASRGAATDGRGR